MLVTQLTPGADDTALENRTRWLRQYLRDRPEKHIVVVTHGDFLRRLTHEPDYPWNNAQVRLFQFDESTVHMDHCPLRHVCDIEAGGWNGTIEADTDSLSGREQRLKQMLASVQSQAGELEELDRRLAAADQRKEQLEAQTQKAGNI